MGVPGDAEKHMSVLGEELDGHVAIVATALLKYKSGRLTPEK